MKGDAKIYAMLNSMTARQLGSLILQAGYALPFNKSKAGLFHHARALYEAGGGLNAALIVEVYEEEK